MQHPHPCAPLHTSIRMQPRQRLLDRFTCRSKWLRALPRACDFKRRRHTPRRPAPGAEAADQANNRRASAPAGASERQQSSSGSAATLPHAAHTACRRRAARSQRLLRARQRVQVGVLGLVAGLGLDALHEQQVALADLAVDVRRAGEARLRACRDGAGRRLAGRRQRAQQRVTGSQTLRAQSGLARSLRCGTDELIANSKMQLRLRRCCVLVPSQLRTGQLCCTGRTSALCMPLVVDAVHARALRIHSTAAAKQSARRRSEVVQLSCAWRAGKTAAR